MAGAPPGADGNQTDPPAGVRTPPDPRRPPAIEPTTGAPITALPQRAPLRTTTGPWTAAADSSTEATGGSTEPPGPAEPVTREPAFWLPIEEVHWDGTPVRRDTETWLDRRRSARLARRQRTRPPRPQRSAIVGLPAAVLLSLVAAFFSSVSAEPLWLAIGHGHRGTATVTGCTGQGLNLRCRGDFSVGDGTFTAHDVRLTGVAAGRRDPGSPQPAWMVGPGSGTAYVEAGGATRHLHWLLGMALVLACGPAIVWVTGALRLPDRRARRRAALAGLAGPLLLAVGFLVAAF